MTRTGSGRNGTDESRVAGGRRYVDVFRNLGEQHLAPDHEAAILDARRGCDSHLSQSM